MRIDKLIESMGDDLSPQRSEALLRRLRLQVDRALQPVRRPEVAVGVTRSPLGDLLIALGDRGIVLNHYLSNGDDLAETIARLRWSMDPVEDRRAINEVGDEIRRYLGGEANALRRKADLALVASSFQRKLLDKLQEIPRGALVSYRSLGAAAGAPKSARAVGNAMHNNPVPIYVPCHRVITSDGRIGGYGGGVERKLQLLRSEGFVFADSERKLPDTVVLGHQRTHIYCRPDCRSASAADRSQILIFADARAAQRTGMHPCKVCRPA